MKHFVELALSRGAEQAEAYFLESRRETIEFENNELQQVASKKLQGLYLKAVKDGKVGVVASSDLTQPEKLVTKALELAKYGDPLPYDFVTPGAQYPEVELIGEKVYELSTEELVQESEKMIKTILGYDLDIKVGVKVIRTSDTKQICNSTGLNITSTVHDYLAYGVGFLVEGDNFITTIGIATTKDGRVDFANIANQVIERMKLARVTVPMESGKHQVIFTPRAVAQMMAALKGLNGDEVVKGISPLKDKLNTQIFDEQITIIDDGTLKEGAASDRFDDQGTPTQRTVLIDRGVLKGYIHDLKSAKEMGVKSTGNGWKEDRGYHRPANPTFSNVVVTPGATSFDEMIRDIKVGLIIDDISGLQMGNLSQGNIDSDIDMAYKIENGKVTGRVKNGAIGTNIYQIFKHNVVAVGDKLEPGFGSEGLVYAPYIMCKDINITIG